jgi:hypothetical protein
VKHLLQTQVFIYIVIGGGSLPHSRLLKKEGIDHWNRRKKNKKNE